MIKTVSKEEYNKAFEEADKILKDEEETHKFLYAIGVRQDSETIKEIVKEVIGKMRNLTEDESKARTQGLDALSTFTGRSMEDDND